MVIGPSGAGKTRLVLLLENSLQTPKKSQDIIYRPLTMDVPSAYLENNWMYRYIISAAQDASHVLLLADSTQTSNFYPPGFAKALPPPVTGVITKVDCPDGNLEHSVNMLRSAGVTEPYFQVSLTTKAGMNRLRAHLFQDESNED